MKREIKLLLLVCTVCTALTVLALGSCAVEAEVAPSVTVDGGGTQWICLIPSLPEDDNEGAEDELRIADLILVFSTPIAAFTADIMDEAALAGLFTFTYDGIEEIPEELKPRAIALTKDAEGVYILTVLNVPNVDSTSKVLVTINTLGILPPSQVWTLNAAPVVSDADGTATLLEFRFKAEDNLVLDADVVGKIDQQQKTVAVLLPPETPLSALTPTLTLNLGSTSLEAGANDFTVPPVLYTVTAADGIRESIYRVTVTVEGAEGIPNPIVSLFDLSSFITAPVEGENPSPALTANGSVSSVPFATAQYTGVVFWSINDNSNGVFDDTDDYSFYADSIYTATVVLATKTSYTFTGVLPNSFTYSNYAHTHSDDAHGQISSPNGSGGILTVSIVFPKVP